jgi:hypothetical protein
MTPNRAGLIRLSDRKLSPRRIAFDREELNLLLALYSRRVAGGEWRDYAIDLGVGMAVFSVFRRAEDRPVIAIAKCTDAPGTLGGFVLFEGSRILKKARTLTGVLAALEPNLRLVVSNA